MIKLDEIESLKERRDEIGYINSKKQMCSIYNAETNAGILANNGETLEKLKKQREELNKLKTLNQQQADDAKYNVFKNFIDDMARAIVDFFDLEVVDSGSHRAWIWVILALGRQTLELKFGMVLWVRFFDKRLIAQIERVVNKPYRPIKF